MTGLTRKKNMRDELASATIKATPPAAVTAYTYVLGMPIEKWVSVGTLIYIVLQVFFLIYDRIKKGRDAGGQK